jgi:hypothetical protein
MKQGLGWRVVLFLSVAGTVFGQGRSAGLHGAYATLAAGAEAPLYNPANLAFSSGSDVTIALLGVSGWLDDNAFGLESYRRYNGAYLDEADKSDILATIADKGLVGRAGVSARPFSIAVGPAALSLQTRALTRITLAEELFSLLFKGNALDVAYDFAPAEGQAMVLSDIALSYGYSPPFTLRGVHSLCFGLSGHYYIGSYYGEVERMQARALTGTTLAQADGLAWLRKAEGGRGWGLDLGMTAVINAHFRAGLVAENLITRVEWDKKSERLQADFTLHATNIDRIMEEDLAFEDVVLHSDTTLAIPAFATRLPRRWHLSGSYLSRKYLISAEWVAGESGAAALGGSNLALGAEYAPWGFLRLRGGVGHMAESGWGSSLGLGLHFLGGRWDFAWQGVGSLNPNAVRGALVATSLFFDL